MGNELLTQCNAAEYPENLYRYVFNGQNVTMPADARATISYLATEIKNTDNFNFAPIIKLFFMDKNNVVRQDGDKLNRMCRMLLSPRYKRIFTMGVRNYLNTYREKVWAELTARYETRIKQLENRPNDMKVGYESLCDNINNLPLSTRAKTACRNAGWQFLGEVAQCDSNTFWHARGIGEKTGNEILEFMNARQMNVEHLLKGKQENGKT